MSGKPLAVYVTPCLGHALDAFPAEVAVLQPGPGIVDLPELLDSHGLKPDILLQDERLAPRTLLKGLETLDCPRIFWSLDPHLNHYWQAHYAALFDVAVSTQKAWAEPLARAGAGRAEWLTWCAPAAPWTPHGQRSRAAAFVGRLSGFRPARTNFVRFLQDRFAVRVETDIPSSEVQGTYADARLAPNESIQGEITQRLFTAAGAGCLVLEPGGDNGLGELFEIGGEVEVYHDALELAEAMARALADPVRAERMGLAARERLLREHLPEHRMAALGRMALSAPSAAPRGLGGERLFWLAAARCLESGRVDVQPGTVLEGLEEHQEDPECLTAILRLLALGGLTAQALEMAARYASAGLAPAHAGYRSTLSALALDGEDFPLALGTYFNFLRATGQPGERPETPAALLAAWGDLMLRADARVRSGFAFDPGRHVPAVAAEFYHASLLQDPENLAVLRKAESLLRDVPGGELVRLGYLSELSLRSRDDFRLGLAVGLADLKVFRAAEGLEEIRLSRDLARSRGRGAAFDRLLASGDRLGLVRSALETS